MPLGGGLVSSAASIALGLWQKSQADKKSREADSAASRNGRPTYSINPEEFDNLALANSRAQQGLSAGSLQAYQSGANQGLASSISAILKGGGNPNDINNSYDAYLGNMNKLTLINDQAQVANVNNAIAQRQRMSEQKDKAFEFNQYAPFVDKAKAIAQMKQSAINESGAATAGIIGGLGSLGGAAIQMGQRAALNKKPQLLDVPQDAPPSNNTTAAPYYNPLGNGTGNASGTPMPFDPQHWAQMSSDQRNTLMKLYGY